MGAYTTDYVGELRTKSRTVLRLDPLFREELSPQLELVPQTTSHVFETNHPTYGLAPDSVPSALSDAMKYLATRPIS